MSGGSSSAVRSPLQPPANEPLTDDGGNISQAWLAWFQMLADSVGGRNAGLARTGSTTSNGMYEISGTFDPPFTATPTISLYDAAGDLVAIKDVVAYAGGWAATAPDQDMTYTWMATE